MFSDDRTEILENNRQSEGTAKRENKNIPRLFVCQGRIITEHRVEGHQLVGRPSTGNEPEISIPNRFVSRRHGIFDTKAGRTVFTACPTTNGIIYGRRVLKAGQSVTMHDGDEMVIPSCGENEGDGSSIVLVYASGDTRIGLWRNFMHASADKLTGLGNRDNPIAWWQRNYWRSDYAHGIIFILDIDNFKKINDTMGHNVGDAVIKAVSKQILSAVRYENQVCRWGGDEFVGIIPGNLENCRERLEILSSKIARMKVEAGVSVTVSIGCANIEDAADPLDMKELVGMADKALYDEKRRGKGGISLYMG